MHCGVAGQRGREGQLLGHFPPQLAVPVHRVDERALQEHLCLLLVTSAAAPGFPLALGVGASGTLDACAALNYEAGSSVLSPLSDFKIWNSFL